MMNSYKIINVSTFVERISVLWFLTSEISCREEFNLKGGNRALLFNQK